MAKSASDTKVEDVLSSVRRLVSDELPRNERPALPEGPGALVLTDAQRIESTAAMRVAGRTLEERIAELEVAISDTANDDEFEPDGSEDQAQHRPDRIVYTRPPDPEESDQVRRNTLRLSEIALIDTGPANEDDDTEGSDVQLQFRREGSVDEAPMAEDVKETLTAAEVHAFTSPDDEVARIEARLNGDPEPTVASRVESVIDALSGDNKPPASDFEEFEELEELDAFEEDGDPSKPEAPADVETKSTPSDDVLQLRPEAEVDVKDEAFDADLEAAVSSVETSEELNPIETAAAEVPAQVEGAADDDAADDALAHAAISASVFEVMGEDELRPVVSQILREELQGELGERITRNVRKLVRREILRALAARDAE